MAVGDIISGIFGATVIASFQPSAGTEIMITSCLGRNTTVYFGIMNGVIEGFTDYDESTSIGGRNAANIKIGITNTNYLRIYANSVGASFSGIQLK